MFLIRINCSLIIADTGAGDVCSNGVQGSHDHGAE